MNVRDALSPIDLGLTWGFLAQDEYDDAVIFTAGIGENDSAIREKVVSELGFMGIKIDTELNKTRGQAIDVSADGATVKTLVIPTNEELMIALDTKRLVEG